MGLLMAGNECVISSVSWSWYGGFCLECVEKVSVSFRDYMCKRRPRNRPGI